MKIAIILVIVIGIIALIGTMLIAGKGDANYREKTKRNSINLTVIYAVVILLSLIAVGIYIKMYV
ncbi:hypothetical protein DZB84_15595 [Bacillus sp. HNG]|uniref:hypothetical protein n=1 Tax=Bacillus sp. HNG TaxID=2293325 RepID=UPI000E2F86AD|nr:hypothetical protein [Bacillus sp. HNG]RFB14853.1 hypothetical protein DZB84_15595 [Bacillus sp. HNG]